MVDVTWEADLKSPVTLDMLRQEPSLADLIVLRRGNRLSITPVEPAHFARICELGGLGQKTRADARR
jgi:predicted RNA-binding protein with PUA-like domain